MDVMNLMELFANPESLKHLTLSQKMLASLVTTMLGMGITFLSLCILQVVIGLLARFAGSQAVPRAEVITTASQPDPQVELRRQQELVAAISVALAAQLGTSPSNIIVRDIRRKDDLSPTWSKVGLTELMNNNA